MKTLAMCRRGICFLVGGRSKLHGLFEILIEDSDTKCQKMGGASAVLAQSRYSSYFLEAAQQPESSMIRSSFHAARPLCRPPENTNSQACCFRVITGRKLPSPKNPAEKGITPDPQYHTGSALKDAVPYVHPPHYTALTSSHHPYTPGCG